MVMNIPNQGSKYLGAYVDDNEQWLDGSNTYEIKIPENAPAADFWSITVYDAKTRTLIQNKLGDATVGSRDNSLKVENDGSFKLYTGPEAPAGYENNWVQTNDGDGFFVYLRLYGPTTAYFDKSWKMPDIRKVN